LWIVRGSFRGYGGGHSENGQSGDWLLAMDRVVGMELACNIGKVESKLEVLENKI
jgi:hypothetical protein